MEERRTSIIGLFRVRVLRIHLVAPTRAGEPMAVRPDDHASIRQPDHQAIEALLANITSVRSRLRFVIA
jgi:hypothetical protein